jgi:hypothetical protein
MRVGAFFFPGLAFRANVFEQKPRFGSDALETRRRVAFVNSRWPHAAAMNARLNRPGSLGDQELETWLALLT